MATLKIQAPDGKFLRVDVSGHDKSEYDDLATAAVEDYMSRKPHNSPEVEAQRKLIASLESQGVDQTVLAAQRAKLVEMTGQKPVEGVTVGDVGGAVLDTLNDTGTLTKAGFTGTADLVAGNGLDKSLENIEHVKKGEDPTSAAGVIGEALGAQFTPGQIALQASFGKVAEMVGPALGGVLKSWGEKAALNAVGMIRSIAETLNIDMPALAQFLMKPVTLGGKEFAPIVSATSSAPKMLAGAKTIQKAAGQELGRIATLMDGAIKEAIDSAGPAMNDSPVILNLAKLRPELEKLKEAAVGGWEDVEPAVVQKFDAIIQSLDKFIQKEASGPTNAAFSDLSAMRTKLGGLTNFKSQGENQVAMQQAYGVISNVLKEAAEKVGGSVGQEFRAANAVYHESTAVISALEGKELKYSLKDIFAPGAFGFIGSMIGGLPGLVAGSVTGAVANTYGHQAIARGLNAVAPVAAKGLEIGLRSLPVGLNAAMHGNAIADALNQDQ